MLAGYFISNVINIKGFSVAERNLFYCLWLYPLPNSLWFSRTRFPFPIEIWLEGSNSSWISLGWIEWEAGGGGCCWFSSNLYSDITFPPLTPIMPGKHTSIKEKYTHRLLSPIRGHSGWHLIWSSINITIKLQSTRNPYKDCDGPWVPRTVLTSHMM